MKDSQRFLLLDYNPSRPAKIGAFDILKVQQKGKSRYLPFITKKDNILRKLQPNEGQGEKTIVL
jgi:hypothetical protein